MCYCIGKCSCAVGSFFLYQLRQVNPDSKVFKKEDWLPADSEKREKGDKEEDKRRKTKQK